MLLASGKGTSRGTTDFSSGFMPSHYQATLFRNQGDPILYLTNRPGVTNEILRETIDGVNDMNRFRYAETGVEEIASRINAYEPAFRMQTETPALADFSDEPPATLEMYGIESEKENRPQRQYATNCLLARRLVERGVRTVLMMDAS